MSIFIIAEAGVNHNGSREIAFKLIDAAIDAGVDAVKFQTFKAEHLVTKSSDKANYQKETTSSKESHFSMLQRLELSYQVHIDLAKYCQTKGIKFLSTAFDSESLEFLTDKVELDILKYPSGDLTNGPLLLEHARTGKNIILSTGMATLGEIEVALGVIAFGYIGSGEPSLDSFQNAYFSIEGQEELKKKVTLLHCTTEYPAPLIDINLRAMDTISSAFGLQVGYSDHSKGITVPIAAAARGATLLEKHFTLDRTLPGPDHQASLEPDELKNMVQAIRDVEKALGNGKKIPSNSELLNRDIARKSIVASKTINKGEFFLENNLSMKRPGTGKSPMEYWSLLGKINKKNVKEDEQI